MHPTAAEVEQLAVDQRWLPEGQACRSFADTAEELEEEYLHRCPRGRLQ